MKAAMPPRVRLVRFDRIANMSRICQETDVCVTRSGRTPPVTPAVCCQQKNCNVTFCLASSIGYARLDLECWDDQRGVRDWRMCGKIRRLTTKVQRR